MLTRRNSLMIVLIVACFHAIPSSRAAETVMDKPFEVESGVIEMKKSVRNSVVTSETVETFYFKEFGRIQSRFSTETVTNKYVKTPAVTRTFTLTEGAVITKVDMDKLEGTRMTNPMAGSFGTMTPEEAKKFAAKMGEATNTKGTRVGQEQVAGKPCDVWEAVTEMGTKKQTTRTYFWKNILLKTVSSGMGTDILEEATSVKTDGTIPADRFQAPKGAKITELKMP